MTMKEYLDQKQAYSLLFEVPLSNPMRTFANIENINQAVELATGEADFYESMKDFESQIKQGFVKICIDGFCVMADMGV